MNPYSGLGETEEKKNNLNNNNNEEEEQKETGVKEEKERGRNFN